MKISRTISFLLTSTALASALALAIIPCAAEAQQNDEPLSREETLAQQNQQITLHSGPLETESDFLAQAVVVARSLADEGPSVLAVIVELEEPLTPERRAEFEQQGAILEDYLGGTTYVFSVPANFSGPLGESLQRLAVGGAVLGPEAKVLPSARTAVEFPADLSDGAERSDPGLAVTFLRAVDPDEARAVLEARGFEVTEQLSPNAFVVNAGPEQADALAAIQGVKTVDRGPLPLLPLNDTGRRNADTDKAQLFSLNSPAPSYGGVTGAGIRIAIADTGVDENHDDFDSVTAEGAAGSTRVYNARPGSDGHGTHVASIAGGSGLNSDANGFPAFSLRGHAPEAWIGDYPQLGSSFENYHDAIVGGLTHVSNHSYVQSFNGYGTAAQLIDELVRGDALHGGEEIPPRPQVWAAGNNGFISQWGNEEGYFSVFTSAKNTISVGSTDSRDDRVSQFSSRGPTFDGRVKPDVMAPGCRDNIPGSTLAGGTRIQAADNNTQGYIGDCGTSMAAPVVTGTIALMMESHVNNGAPGGILHPSTYKAILVHTARDMVKTANFADREFDDPDTSAPIRYYPGPDFATGYGLIDADAAVETIAASNQWREAILGQSGEADTFCVQVPTGAASLRATLAWDDEAGSTLTSITTPKLVNDLDLELVAPDGTISRPWTLDPLPVVSPAGGGGLDPITNADVVPARRDVDRRNTVELAEVNLPESGEWRIRVRGFNLPNANAQSYSLVSSERIKPICLTGPDIVVPICERYPWICGGIPEIGPIVPIDWQRPVPIDEICKYALDCPGCESARPGAYCPGFRFQVEGLPRDARITVFDGSGRIVRTASGTTPSIIIEKREPGVSASSL